MNIFKGWSKMNGHGRLLAVTLCFTSLGLLTMIVSPFFCFVSWKIALNVFIFSFGEIVVSVMAWLLGVTFWNNADSPNKMSKK